jgi:hypothetical protein
MEARVIFPCLMLSFMKDKKFFVKMFEVLGPNNSNYLTMFIQWVLMLFV